MPNSVSFTEGCSFFVNPITAIGLVDIVSNANGRGVVISAAASQLGKMMIRLFNQKRITVVATVRKEEQEQELREKFGLEHVFNTTEDDFLPKFKDVAKEVRAKHLLECIGGPISGKLISNMPKGSHVYLYGNLSKQPISELD